LRTDTVALPREKNSLERKVENGGRCWTGEGTLGDEDLPPSAKGESCPNPRGLHSGQETERRRFVIVLLPILEAVSFLLFGSETRFWLGSLSVWAEPRILLVLRWRDTVCAGISSLEPPTVGPWRGFGVCDSVCVFASDNGADPDSASLTYLK
jgi:hypothetical protein